MLKEIDMSNLVFGFRHLNNLGRGLDMSPARVLMTALMV